MYYVLAYPAVSPSDSAFIETFRERYDLPYKEMVAAHFTLVFGLRNWSEAALLKHVQHVCSQTRAIEFVCRYAMLGADHASETAHVFLVPDEGFSAVSLLHDQLYSGPLASALRLDLEYIPHVTIATLEDRTLAKEQCDLLNARPLSLCGRIDEVTVVELQGRTLRKVAVFTLQGNAA